MSTEFASTNLISAMVAIRLADIVTTSSRKYWRCAACLSRIASPLPGDLKILEELCLSTIPCDLQSAVPGDLPSTVSGDLPNAVPVDLQSAIIKVAPTALEHLRASFQALRVPLEVSVRATGSSHFLEVLKRYDTSIDLLLAEVDFPTYQGNIEEPNDPVYALVDLHNEFCSGLSAFCDELCTSAEMRWGELANALVTSHKHELCFLIRQAVNDGFYSTFENADKLRERLFFTRLDPVRQSNSKHAKILEALYQLCLDHWVSQQDVMEKLGYKNELSSFATTLRRLNKEWGQRIHIRIDTSQRKKVKLSLLDRS